MRKKLEWLSEEDLLAECFRWNSTVFLTYYQNRRIRKRSATAKGERGEKGKDVASAATARTRTAEKEDGYERLMVNIGKVGGVSSPATLWSW